MSDAALSIEADEFQTLLDRLVSSQSTVRSIRATSRQVDPSLVHNVGWAHINVVLRSTGTGSDALTSILAQRRSLLERAMALHEREFEEASFALRRMQNASQPIFRVPDEVLLEIMALARFGNDTAPQTLRGVSSRFLDLMDSPAASVLWSIIKVDITHRSLIPRATNMLLQASSRSRSAPLYLTIHRNSSANHLMSVLIQSVNGILPRVRELTLVGALSIWLPLGNLPSLRTLSIDAGGATIPRNLFRNATTTPQISSLVLDSWSQMSPIEFVALMHNVATRTNIEHLDLSISVHTSISLTALRQFPRLRSLRWSRGVGSLGNGAQTVPLPALRKLVVGESIMLPSAILLLDAPNVHILELEHIAHDDIDLDDLWGPSQAALLFPNLRVLKLAEHRLGWTTHSMASFIFAHSHLRLVLLPFVVSNAAAFVRDITSRLVRRLSQGGPDSESSRPLPYLQRIELYHPRGVTYSASDVPSIADALATLLVCLDTLPPSQLPGFTLGLPRVMMELSAPIAEMVEGSDRLFVSGDGRYEDSVADA